MTLTFDTNLHDLDASSGHLSHESEYSFDEFLSVGNSVAAESVGHEGDVTRDDFWQRPERENSEV